MNIKKFLALLLALVLVLSLAACGGKKPAASPSVAPSPTPTPTAEPSPSAEPSPEPSEEVVKTLIAPADLVGTWNILAWDLQVGGMYTKVTDQYFIFTEDTLDYTVDGASKSKKDYVFKDEDTITLGGSLDWNLYLNEEGTLVIEDLPQYLVYYCVKVDDSAVQPTTQPSATPSAQPSASPSAQPSATPSAQPSASPSAQPSQTPKPSESPKPDKTAISKSKMVGTWNLYAWDLYTGGMYTEVADQYIVFSNTHMTYTVGGVTKSHNAYTFKDEYTINLDGVLDWILYLNKDNVLVIEDPTQNLIYYCKRTSDSTVPPSANVSDKPSMDKAKDLTSVSQLKGKWTILGWIVKADNSFDPSAKGQTYDFSDSKMVYDSGAQKFETSFTLSNGTVNLADWGTSWPGWFNAKGQLCLDDPRYGIVYICEKK